MTCNLQTSHDIFLLSYFWSQENISCHRKYFVCYSTNFPKKSITNLYKNKPMMTGTILLWGCRREQEEKQEEAQEEEKKEENTRDQKGKQELVGDEQEEEDEQKEEQVEEQEEEQ